MKKYATNRAIETFMNHLSMIVITIYNFISILFTKKNTSYISRLRRNSLSNCAPREKCKQTRVLNV